MKLVRDNCRAFLAFEQAKAAIARAIPAYNRALRAELPAFMRKPAFILPARIFLNTKEACPGLP